ncbi:ferritin-like domain-containing protein [Mycobacterium sp. MYCO198283]|uniref:ferritin-like domain-containing protein n=1 Tax=Mycobacterium sp. MYCO198283 TaxID=2883505 RepID=UPI001E2D2EA6|nr:ferritin-like domain-containing protein [Mycobacterium sp. MYCO198283]MCG5433796.1 ferritin-like domain-containing protein [Mycobacterium sp. MYCO198283]
MTSPAPPPSTARPDDPADAALADAVAVEHATIYGYGVVSAHCAPDVNHLVSASLREHRRLRDAATGRLTARDVTAPVAAAGYQLPDRVAGPADAARLATRMEDDAAVAWRAVVEQAGSAEERRFAVGALTGCAVRAARWRQVLQTPPLTEPFPGGPE